MRLADVFAAGALEASVQWQALGVHSKNWR